MLGIRFESGLKTVLCIGAHCDDVEIGCGGTLLELQAQHPQAAFHWAVFSSEDGRGAETRDAARQLIANPQALTLDIHDFRASYYPAQWAEIKDRLEALKAHVKPDVIFTHGLADRHQDHRVLAELTWNTFRDHLVLEYEIAKYEGDLGQPNLYVPVALPRVERKLAVLMSSFPSQRSRAWFSEDTFRGLMRLRGVECNSPSGFAEGFHARKLRL